MIKTTTMLKSELSKYSSPFDKISRLSKEGKLFPVVRGIYETDRTTSGYLLSEAIYGPSYLSFEFALAYYGFIPERVYGFSAATYQKRRTKTFQTPFGVFIYKDIPAAAFPFGWTVESENDRWFKIATPEKAICDELYSIRPVLNNKELEELLFDDLRIDEDNIRELKVVDIIELAPKYRSFNVHKFSLWLRRFAR